MKILENIELVVTEGQKKLRCGVCGYELGPAAEGFKKRSLKVERQLSYCQPAMLSPETKTYVLRQYCCPSCAASFEVDLAIKGAQIEESFQLE